MFLTMEAHLENSCAIKDQAFHMARGKGLSSHKTKSSPTADSCGRDLLLVRGLLGNTLACIMAVRPSQGSLEI